MEKSKKRKITDKNNDINNAPTNTEKKDYISHIPLELLAMILSYTSPKEVLSLARSSNYFCRTLVQNPTSEFIWRTARKSACTVFDDSPDGIPDPTPNFTEASYAAYIYDGGNCEACGRYTSEMYNSFALRLRLCRSNSCFINWASVHGINRYLTYYEDIYELLIVFELPYHETFYSGAIPLHGVLYRRLEYEKKLAWLKEKHPNTNINLPIGNFGMMSEKLFKIMEHAKSLQFWKTNTEVFRNKINTQIDQQLRKIADREGWAVQDILCTPTYFNLHRQKKMIMEEMKDQDFNLIRVDVERELTDLYEGRQRRLEEKVYITKRDAVAAHYHRLKSSQIYPIIPPLSEFRELPMIKYLTNRGTATKTDVDVEYELTCTSAIQNMLRDDLQSWTERAEELLGGLLGFPGYRLLSDKKLHPVYRVTARFRCRLCSSLCRNKTAISEKQMTGEGCLDFRMVCSHVCFGLSKKRRLKYKWDAEQFVPDEKAIKVIRKVLNLLGVNEEDACSLEQVKNVGNTIRCLSCDVHIVMKFGHMIGHCKRHDDMSVEIVSEPTGEMSRGGIEYHDGMCSELQRTKSGRRKRGLKIYGCKHCLDPEAGINYPGRLMSFDGLRCHIKARHGIIIMRDEDVFVQTETETRGCTKCEPQSCTDGTDSTEGPDG